MERKHTKMEGKHKMEFLKKLAVTRSHGRRGRMPARNGSDATARLTRSRALRETHMTRTHDWSDRVARKTPIDATAWPTRTRDRGHAPEITEYAPSEFWSPFWPRSKYRQHRPEVIKCGNASIQRELVYFSPFNDIELVEREISLSLF